MVLIDGVGIEARAGQRIPVPAGVRERADQADDGHVDRSRRFAGQLRSEAYPAADGEPEQPRGVGEQRGLQRRAGPCGVRRGPRPATREQSGMRFQTFHPGEVRRRLHAVRRPPATGSDRITDDARVATVAWNGAIAEVSSVRVSVATERASAAETATV